MHDFMGRCAQNNDIVLAKCLQALERYDNGIIGYPAMQLIVEHPRFLELMEKTATQDCLWKDNQTKLLLLLLDSIENRGHCFLNRSLPIQVQLIEIFLAAAEQKGIKTFIDSQTPMSGRTLLGQAVEQNNLACARKILEYGASLTILCYHQKDRHQHTPPP